MHKLLQNASLFQSGTEYRVQDGVQGLPLGVYLSRKAMIVYHSVGKTDWSKVAENGTHQNRNGNFHGMFMFHFHGHVHRDEYKTKGLELVAKANGTHISRFRKSVWEF